MPRVVKTPRLGPSYRWNVRLTMSLAFEVFSTSSYHANFSFTLNELPLFCEKVFYENLKQHHSYSTVLLQDLTVSLFDFY